MGGECSHQCYPTNQVEAFSQSDFRMTNALHSGQINMLTQFFYFSVELQVMYYVHCIIMLLTEHGDRISTCGKLFSTHYK